MELVRFEGDFAALTDLGATKAVTPLGYYYYPPGPECSQKRVGRSQIFWVAQIRPR